MSDGVDVETGRDDVIWVDNGRVRLGIAPRLGGRLLSLRLGEAEFLWRDHDLVDADLRYQGPVELTSPTTLAEWVNLGGDKTWPAPQGWEGTGQWAGPPDPMLDSGAYTAHIEQHDDEAVVRVTSADDPRTGLRISRALTVDAGQLGAVLEVTFTNTSEHPVRWAIWNVTQLPLELSTSPEDGVFVGVEPGPLGLRTVVEGTGVPRARRLGAELVQVPPSEVVGKVGFPTASGWMAHVGRAGTLTWRFPVDTTATYPDGGSRVEVWQESPQPEPIAHLGDLQPANAVVECEVLGPLVELSPGESTMLTMQLSVSAGKERVARVCDAGVIHRDLALEHRIDGSVVVTGRLTAFADGDLVVVRPGGTPAVISRTDGGGTPTNIEISLGQLDAGAEVAVEFSGPNGSSPVARLTVPAVDPRRALTSVDGLSSYRGRGLQGQVVEHLGRAIIGRSLAPGEMIDLDTLEQGFGVSRSVVREAVRVLTAKGLVEARQRMGTSVRHPGAWALLDADVLRWRVEVSDLAAVSTELDEVRAAIEPAAAALAARRRNDVDLAALDAAVADMASAGDRLELAVAADLAFHRAVLAATHNGLMAAMEVVLEAALAARNRAVHAWPHIQDPVPIHRAVVEAIRAYDPDGATAAVHDLLSHARADALRVVGGPEETLE